MSQDAAQAQTSSSGEPSNPQSGVDGGGGDVVQIREALKSTQGELSSTKSALQDYMGRFEQVEKQATTNAEIVGRLREAFDPNAGKGVPDPTVEYQAQLDHYLKAAWEAEKAGRSIPLTTNLAVQFFQDKIDSHKRDQENQKVIKELLDTVKALKDPAREVNHRAASHIDATIEEYVERLYGTDEATFPQRAAQYNAIAEQVKGEIRKLQQEQPQAWEQIRRSTEKQQKLVEWVVNNNQPPKVRQILEQERMKSEPMTDGQLWAAFQEAKQIKDEKTREKVVPQIRADIVARMMERQRGAKGGGFNRLNRR